MSFMYEGLRNNPSLNKQRWLSGLFCLAVSTLLMVLLLPLRTSQARSAQSQCCPELSANDGVFDAEGNPSLQFNAISLRNQQYPSYFNYVGVAPEAAQAIWVAQATEPWIHIYPAIGTTVNGIGSGFAPFTLDPNNGSDRSAKIYFSIRTQNGTTYEVPYKVVQLGSNNQCSYDVLDSLGNQVRYIQSGLAGKSGSLKLVKLNGIGNCGDVRVTANRNWIKILQFKPATGEIKYKLSPNTTDKTGAIIVAGRQIPVVESFNY